MGKTWKDGEIKSWEELNKLLTKATEEDCRGMLKNEIEGRHRDSFVKRIHHRMNKMRYKRERAEL